MTIVFENKDCVLISSEKYFNSTLNIEGSSLKIKPNLFKILSTYSWKTSPTKRHKVIKNNGYDTEIVNINKDLLKDFYKIENDIKVVQNNYVEFLKFLRKHHIFEDLQVNPIKNTECLTAANFVYEESGKNLVQNALGSNIGTATVKTLNNSKFVFPQDCKFFSKNVNEIETHLREEKYDLILLDPPWWNKYIRRKRKKCPHAYNMMSDESLKYIPIENLLDANGIVVIWCTNSSQHLKALKEEIFPKWEVKFVCKWYWLKVTTFGEPVCEFSKPPGKQPFEQIIIGCKNPNRNLLQINEKLVVSIPSAIHSHKPPLVELLKPYLPENPKCLEIFARYLLPSWTSYGNEVLRFQHESLFVFEENARSYL